MKPVTLLLFLLASAGLALGQGRIVWNESVNGPISNDYTQPSLMGALQAGTNSIIGASEIEPFSGGWLGYGDYFAFNVPPTLSLSSLFLTIDNQRTWSWIGTPDFGTQIGFAQNAVNGDLLSQWSLLSVPNGNYAMYMENSDNQNFTTIANYRLDFVVTAVPEPGTWALLGLGGLAFWCLARRRR